jgi:glutathione S-transferase
MLKLYYAPGSCAFAALVALEEAGVPYRPIKLDLSAGDQRTLAYRRINPLGRVPALDVDGKIITELAAVLTYVHGRCPEAGLLPNDDPLKLAQAYERLSWFSTSFHVFVAQVFRAERFTPDPAVQDALKEPGKSNFRAELERLEIARQQSRAEATNGQLSVVDAFELVIWRWAEKLGIDRAAYPNWSASVARLLDFPSVQRATQIEGSGEPFISATAQSFSR